MKATGVVRRLDELGRIVIPIELRRTLDIDLHDPVEITTEEDRIIIRKYHVGCVLCGGKTGITYYREKPLCRRCVTEIQKGL